MIEPPRLLERDLATTFAPFTPSLARLLKLFPFYEKTAMIAVDVFSFLAKRIIPITIGITFALSSLGIRIAATLLHPLDGIKALPRNFRRIVLCTSPAQDPELIPGLDTSNSAFRYSVMLDSFVSRGDVGYLIKYSPTMLIMFVPASLFRITIKSTAWFWWPLAFLGGDLKRVRNPALFHWRVMGSLWAKTSIALAVFSLCGFVAVNFVFDGSMFQRNPLLTPIGYFLLIDWKLQIWQLCALLAAALSILIVYMVNDVSGQYRIAQDTRDAKLLEAATRSYGWIERLTRVRFLLLLAFWGLVGTHAVLYANSTKCRFSLPPALQQWAQDIYGDRLPRSKECRP